MTKKEKPTQDRLHELFSYDPETGIFLRKSGSQRGPKERKYGRIGAGRVSELGYVLIMINGVNHIAGQVAWAYVHGDWPHARIKYVDGNKLNNRIGNIIVQDRDRSKVKETPLTHDRLKELLHYNPENGWFTWRINNSVAKPGERAGGVNGLGYRMIGLEYKKYLEHSLAYFYMTGEQPTLQIDHLNRNKADNRWENLKHGTRSENGHNKGLSSRSSTGFPGVLAHGNGFRAVIAVENNPHNGGWFDTIAQARVSRLLLELKVLGRFTTFDPSHDSFIPHGDKTISLMAGGNRLFVIEDGKPPRELSDVSELEETLTPKIGDGRSPD